jgi:two-component system response regulator
MRQGTILLVEDNDDDVVLTKRALARNHIGNPVVVCSDGAEAIDYLFCQGAHAGRSGELPLVVLLDLKLPKVDGIEVLAAIRSEPRMRSMPVVMLTTSREGRDVEAAYRAGANSYVRKPVDFEDFIRAMGQVGLYWLLLNVPPETL